MSIRKIIGYTFFILSFVTLAIVFILPFLDLSIKILATLTTLFLVGGEVLFFISVVLLKKEIIDKIKSYIKKIIIMIKSKIY